MPTSYYYAWRSWYEELPKGTTAAVVGAVVGSAVGSLFVCLCACCAFALWWRAYGKRRLRVYERERKRVKIVTAPLTSPGSRRSGVLRRGVLVEQMERANARAAAQDLEEDPDL